MELSTTLDIVLSVKDQVRPTFDDSDAYKIALVKLESGSCFGIENLRVIKFL